MRSRVADPILTTSQVFVSIDHRFIDGGLEDVAQ
jgi:hypothetical protein